MKVLTILGTTGVGKTKLSIELAKKFNGEIINADAMQMYQGLDIATNKATVDEMAGIPHHLLSFLETNAEYRVTDFVTDALKKIAEIHGRNKIPVLVGGTNYYIQSLLWDNFLIENAIAKNKETSVENKVDPKLSSFLEKYSSCSEEQIDEGMKQQLHEYLKQVDPVSSDKFHPSNHRRVYRSLTIFVETGFRQSELQRNQIGQQNLRFPTCFFWLVANPHILDVRLDSRVNEMMKNGLLDEVEGVRNCLSTRAKTSKGGVYQTIGLKEFNNYFDMKKEVSADKLDKMKAEGIEAVKLATRQYARSQIKWISKKMIPIVLEKKKQDFTQCTLHTLDTSDMDRWDLIMNQAFTMTEHFLKEQPCPEENSESLDVFLKRPRIEPQEWKKFICPVCPEIVMQEPEQTENAEGKQRVFYGSHEWNEHLQSKRHKYFQKPKTIRIDSSIINHD